ncbi:unnamed protein product [Rotaria sp. Silwood1]|nr:unnamed protein product [Rotaria sp. Silwood1]CAF3699237.1 unnamed protein product [Rotaria sp. Silwood1]CAF4684971.1 unnamed protein product [Rotaria sp. Silwood1]
MQIYFPILRFTHLDENVFLASVSTTTLVTGISIGNQSGSPCSSYTTIDDPSRNIAQSTLYALCDKGSPFNTSNGGSWIRFIGTGGTIIPLISLGMGHCSAYTGGWFNGTLPTTVSAVVNRTFRTPIPKARAFENTELTQKPIDHKDRFVEDHDYTSQSTSILTTELLETNRKQTGSTRSKIITVIIVITVIILIVGIVVGVVAGVSKSEQSTSETTTINNQTSFSVSTTTLVSSISIGNQSGLPCSSYTTIDDPSRNVAQSSLFGSCDNGSPFNASNGGSWIRFIGTGGTIIPLAAPAQGHCGAYVGGWFNGILPTTVSSVGNGTACFSMNTVPCFLASSVSIINCGGFYVYFLPPVSVCNTRYCTT